MANIKTFKAIRYNEEKFPVPPVAPPYDIISEKQRQTFAANEYHMINLEKPGCDDDKDRYSKAADRFASWKNTGVMIEEEEAVYYVYAQRFKHPETEEVFERTGFYGLVELEEHYENCIYPHERTLSAPKADRLDLMKSTKANLSPVFGLYDDPENKAEQIFESVKKNNPIYNTYVDNDGTEHFIWKITSADDQKVLSGVLSGKDIIIADGHHRYATALNYRNEMREKNGVKTEKQPYDYVLMCLINFNNSGLVVLPTHRLFCLNVESEKMLAEASDYFDILETTYEEAEKILLNKKEGSYILAYYCGKSEETFLLTLKEDANLSGVVPDSPSEDWRKLEVNLLFYIIIKKILNIGEDDFQTKIKYTHSFLETREVVDAGEAQCAFLLPANTKDELEKVTQAHEVMPQKSTYFFPKVFAGFVLYKH